MNFSKTLGFKATAAEYQLVQTASKESGINVSDFLRLKVFGEPEANNQHTAISRNTGIKSISKRDIPPKKTQIDTPKSQTIDYLHNNWLNIFKPYPIECNPDNFDMPGMKTIAIIKRMQYANIRAIAFQAGANRLLKF
jgi:hypothetical protein